MLLNDPDLVKIEVNDYNFLLYAAHHDDLAQSINGERMPIVFRWRIVGHSYSGSGLEGQSHLGGEEVGLAKLGPLQVWISQ
ncbi:hypothetical protein [Rhizobium leguminosarum]